MFYKINILNILAEPSKSCEKTEVHLWKNTDVNKWMEDNNLSLHKDKYVILQYIYYCLCNL